MTASCLCCCASPRVRCRRPKTVSEKYRRGVGTRKHGSGDAAHLRALAELLQHLVLVGEAYLPERARGRAVERRHAWSAACLMRGSSRSVAALQSSCAGSTPGRPFDCGFMSECHFAPFREHPSRIMRGPQTLLTNCSMKRRRPLRIPHKHCAQSPDFVSLVRGRRHPDCCPYVFRCRI
jgi:hypothetical protein